MLLINGKAYDASDAQAKMYWDLRAMFPDTTENVDKQFVGMLRAVDVKAQSNDEVKLKDWAKLANADARVFGALCDYSDSAASLKWHGMLGKIVDAREHFVLDALDVSAGVRGDYNLRYDSKTGKHNYSFAAQARPVFAVTALVEEIVGESLTDVTISPNEDCTEVVLSRKGKRAVSTGVRAAAQAAGVVVGNENGAVSITSTHIASGKSWTAANKTELMKAMHAGGIAREKGMQGMCLAYFDGRYASKFNTVWNMPQAADESFDAGELGA